MNLDAKYIAMLNMMAQEVKPTLRELAAETKLSIGSVQSRILQLRKEGLIQGGHAGQARSLHLTALGVMRLESSKAPNRVVGTILEGLTKNS